MRMPIEFLWGFVFGMLIMFGIVTLAAIVQSVVDRAGGRAPWPADSEMVDGTVDDEAGPYDRRFTFEPGSIVTRDEAQATAERMLASQRWYRHD